MAEKTVATKLLIKPGTSLWISDEQRRPLLDPLPAGVTVAASPAASETAVLFADDSASLQAALKRHGADLPKTQSLWVAYPKGNRTDMNRDTVWPMLAETNMRPIGQVAIDDTWSALRFRPLKPGEPQFTGGQS